MSYQRQQTEKIKGRKRIPVERNRTEGPHRVRTKYQRKPKHTQQTMEILI